MQPKDLTCKLSATSVLAALTTVPGVCGDGVMRMDMEGRMTLTNMVIEAGSKDRVIEPDQTTFDYVADRTSAEYTPQYNDLAVIITV